MITTSRSRLSPSESQPYNMLAAHVAQEAQKAEVILLRKLLLRACAVLQDVAIEARTAGEPDAISESLLRDIAAALDANPTLI